MPSTPASKPGKPRLKRSRTGSSTASRRSQQIPKTEITINVYDLLPPGRFSNLLWTIGGSLLHSGIVIGGREYAYGGHNRSNLTGVYWTKPGMPPAGATFRGAFLQGFTFRPASEIDEIVRAVSLEFLGPKYNLLTCNCNHFTSALCEKLTGRAAPAWMNRAASVGVALPCVVPREWIAPPDVETADGELLDEGQEEGGYRDEVDDDDDDYFGGGESSGMLEGERRRNEREEWRRRKQQEQQAADQEEYSSEEETSDDGGGGHSLAGGSRIRSSEDTPPPRLVAIKDSSGRQMPVAERAPVPRKT